MESGGTIRGGGYEAAHEEVMFGFRRMALAHLAAVRRLHEGMLLAARSGPRADRYGVKRREYFSHVFQVAHYAGMASRCSCHPADGQLLLLAAVAQVLTLRDEVAEIIRPRRSKMSLEEVARRAAL